MKQPHAAGNQDRPPQRVRHILGFELRDKLYAKYIRLCLIGSLITHASVIFLGGRYVDEPVPFKIIGYEGSMQLLPELSILEEQEAQRERRESIRGGGMRWVSYETTEEKARIKEAIAKEQDKRIDLESRFRQASMRTLAKSPAQPRSSTLVIRKLVKPRYPAVSLSMGVEGKVVLKIHIAEDGRVEDAIVVSSEVDRHCERAAVEAALQCEFKPLLSGGKPTAIWARFPVRFVLADYLLSAQPRDVTRE
jgi:TonB family protein